MRILIYGCTRLTDALAPALVADGHEVTVLDANADRLAILKKQTTVNTLHTTEPLMQDYLLAAGIEPSQAFFALTEDDHLNLLLCQTASGIYNVARVMCRLEDPQLQDLYTQLDVRIIDNGPEFLSTARDYLEG